MTPSPSFLARILSLLPPTYHANICEINAIFKCHLKIWSIIVIKWKFLYIMSSRSRSSLWSRSTYGSRWNLVVRVRSMLATFVIPVSSIFWPLPSFRAQISKLVKINGDMLLGAHLQCEQRAIAVLQTVATTFTSSLDKEEVAYCQDKLFSIVVSDVISK